MSDRAEQLYEQVLVLRCQTGDAAAFAELVGRYGPRLRYFVRKMLAPAADVEDVLQEVWLDVFRGVARLAAPAAFRTWLYRVARDRTLRTLRGRRPAPKPLPEEAADEGDDGSDFTAE